VLRRRALADARAVEAAGPPRLRELYRRARLALELADRTLDAVDPLRAGSGAPLAIGLYREAVYWALACLAGETSATEDDPKTGDARLKALWEATLPGSVERVHELIVTRTFIEHGDENEAVQTADATVLRGFAKALVARAGVPELAIERHERQRAVRITGVLVASTFVAVLAASGIGVLLRKPDLAKGKPWRASSTWAECTPSKRQCGPVTDTGIFFHTNEDASPWVEMDLGAPTSFSSMSLKNRGDCCGDRAVPLVIEIGNDQKTWTEIARKKEDFQTWNPQFPKQNARYVRVRVDRKSWLHLDKVAVHP
jgi:hypothetical protein